MPPAPLGLLVATPTQRLKIGKLKRKRWTVRKRNHVMHFCCCCQHILFQAVLTQVVVTLQRLPTHSSPCRPMIEAVIIWIVFFHGYFCCRHFYRPAEWADIARVQCVSGLYRTRAILCDRIVELPDGLEPPTC